MVRCEPASCRQTLCALDGPTKHQVDETKLPKSVIRSGNQQSLFRRKSIRISQPRAEYDTRERE
jgi:hypothetical protein